MKNIINILLVIVLVFSVSGCKDHYYPKPKGYFRIDFPEKEYQEYNSECGVSFMYPKYCFALVDSTRPCWIDLYYPYNNAIIYLTYNKIEDNLEQHLSDSREFVYKHVVKADAIKEKFYKNYDKDVYGIMYEIKGNAASQIQFYATDSVNHFLRGALYFNNTPNADSVAPVVDFIKEDVSFLFESIVWK